MTPSNQVQESTTGPSVAVVTGGAGGIGQAIGVRLKADGHLVALLDLSDSVHDVAKDLGLDHSVRLDVSSSEDVARAMRDVVDALEGVHVVVNAAGVAHRSSFADTSADEFMTDVRINLLGTFLMCQAAVHPYMRASGRGRLINIASASAVQGGIGSVRDEGGRSGAGYASSKAGVVNLTRWIAREVGPYGVTSNAISPGLVWTPMTVGASSYGDLDIPLGRAADPTDIAGAVSFLAGCDATYINGAVISVDGGLTLG